MKKKIIAGVLAVAGVTALGACDAYQTTGDRRGPNGSKPDSYQDITHVTVYRNADQVPNVATFCVGQYGFASTLRDSTDSKAPSSVILRFPELDHTCAS